MSMPNPYQQYKQNAVQCAAPGQLTMMLYDGLVKFLKLAVMAIEQKDLAGSHNSLVRSQEILAYLNETLNHQYELSKNLSALYEFMSTRLQEANIKKDCQIAGEVLELAGELRETWQQALKVVRETGS